MNDASFLNESMCLTQEQAQINRYAVGLWSQDQYEAFMHVWSRNKFGHMAEGWQDTNYSTPEVARLVGLIEQRVANT